MIGIFLSFFFLFAFVLYPFRNTLHPHQFADKLEILLPLGCRGLIALMRNWTYTLFYVMSELWSTAIMTVLFWGFANEIISVNEAKRFHALLGICGNGSGIIAGTTVTFMSHVGMKAGTIFKLDAWGCSLMLLTSFFILTSIAILAVFRWFSKNSLSEYLNKKKHLLNEEQEKVQMGLKQNFSFLIKSKYLICIALIVLTYNICINLTEVVWKDQVQQLYPSPNDFNAYMGKILVGIGITATIIGLIAGAIIRKYQWTVSALIPPIILLITGTLFFSFLLFREKAFLVGLTFLGFTPQMIGVFFGSLQNCFSRGSKYSLFDTTKELAFIPLSKESKLKGKAAIDGVGSRLGKSGGAIIFQGLLLFFGTVSLTTPCVAILLLGAIAVWILAVCSLGKQFHDLTADPKAVLIERPTSLH